MYCYTPLQDPSSIWLIALLPGKEGDASACMLIEAKLSNDVLDYEAISYC